MVETPINDELSGFTKTVKTHKLYTTGQWIAVNISPSVIFQFHHPDAMDKPPSKLNKKYTDPEDRKEAFINYWQRYFQKLINRGALSDFRFYPEISWYGLWHLHGSVKILDPIRFASYIYLLKYTKEVPDVRVDLDTIEDMDKWQQYCSKDYQIIKTIIKPDKDD